MGNQQLYAKVAVFALLGVNVGAYYVFWPSRSSEATSDRKAPRAAKGEAEWLPDPVVKAPHVAKPKELAAAFQQEAAPTPKVDPIKKPASDEVAADELVRKLIEHMEKESRPIDSPMVPVAGKKDPAPRPLPPLRGDPLLGARKDLDPAKVGVTSPLTPKIPQDAWLLQPQSESTGGKTVVVATLRQSGEAFRLSCDRFNVSPDGAEVLATGDVSFFGAGVSVRCKRLTLPLAQLRVVFEEQVIVTPSASAGFLSTDRVVWDFPVIVPKSTVSPAVLGAPK